MKSLIIGAGGFVGPYLMRHLKRDLGHDVAVTKMRQEKIAAEGNIDDTHTKMNAAEGDIDGYDIYDLNILNQSEIEELFHKVRPDYIFHLAAQSSVSESWKNPALTVDVNVKGAVNVLEALRRLDDKPRIVLVGSGEEYGQADYVKSKGIDKACGNNADCICEVDDICRNRIREDERLNPVNIYAATKACQNMLGSIYARAYGLEILMVRAFNHIGPNQAPLFAVADFCRQAALIEAGKKEPVIWVGNLKVKRDFTDVRDVVRAYAMVAAHGAAGETYNVGSGRAVSLEEILRIILRMSETEISVVVDPKKLRPADLPVMEADPDRLQKATGWKPLIGLEQTIKETLDYWRVRVKDGESSLRVKSFS